MRNPPPDFIIAGAPKCGTTAIYRTLQLHDELFLPSVKEPHYFAFEYMERRPVHTLKDYDALYKNASDSQLRGDGSIMYLSSEQAIPAIQQRCPNVKVIAVVRNPVDMFLSWHNQCLKNLDEELTDPELAWRAQAERAAGRKLPGLCHEPSALQFRNICALGTQVRRLFEVVPAARRLVLVFDDLERYPGIIHKQITDFLGVRDQGRTEFLRENVYARPRSIMAARLTRAVRKYRLLKQIRLKVKPFLNRHGVFTIESLFARNLSPVEKPVLRQEFRDELIAEFSPEVMALEGLLGRDLRDWRSREASSDQARAHG